MAVFIVLWPYLSTTKLRSVIRHNLGHSNKDGDVFYGRPLVQENIVKNCLVVYNHFWLAQQTTFQITTRRQNSKLLV